MEILPPPQILQLSTQNVFITRHQYSYFTNFTYNTFKNKFLAPSLKKYRIFAYVNNIILCFVHIANHQYWCIVQYNIQYSGHSLTRTANTDTSRVRKREKTRCSARDVCRFHGSVSWTFCCRRCYRVARFVFWTYSFSDNCAHYGVVWASGRFRETHEQPRE